jgi:uncharacterized protein
MPKTTQFPTIARSTPIQNIFGYAFALALILPMTLASTPVKAQSTGPSFSCARAPLSGIEQLICSDRDLSRQDLLMARTFAKARAAVRGSEGLGELIDSQRAWLVERAECANLRTQKGYCVEASTKSRIEALDQWASLRTNPARAVQRPTKTGTTTGSRPPQGPSFNCARTTNVVERSICADRSLSILDREVASLYRRATTKLAPSDARNLATEQRDFLANRNQCARRTSDRMACIQTAYEMRSLRLGEWLSGEPAH